MHAGPAWQYEERCLFTRWTWYGRRRAYFHPERPERRAQGERDVFMGWTLAQAQATVAHMNSAAQA